MSRVAGNFLPHERLRNSDRKRCPPFDVTRHSPSQSFTSPTSREPTVGKRRQRPTPHAEGEHGPKTEARIIEQLQSRPAELPAAARADLDRIRAAFAGKRRLVEDRQQHDEAEKKSEQERLRAHPRDGLREKGRP